MPDRLTSFDPLLQLLQTSPLGIFSDIDGTLAPIVPRPDDAAVSERNRELLSALVERGVRVALITGRTLDVARRMVGVGGVAYGAGHGLELWVDGKAETPPAVQPYVSAARAVLRDVGDLRVDGLEIEDKGAMLAFHYRRSLNEWAARGAILDALGRSDAAEKFEVHEGKKVVELRPALEITKGTALTELASRLGVRSMICLGDDTTDVDMFEAAGGLRETGVPVAIVAVESAEVVPEVLDAADYVVDGVGGVEWLLSETLSALR